MKSRCEDCLNRFYDEEYEEYCCSINLDQDEISGLYTNPDMPCPFFRFGDDYTIVKKQI